MRRLLPAVLVVTAMTLATSTPARAESGVGLSPDGVGWGPTLTQPLFEESVRWVPGDVRTARFFVRNRADSGAVLTVSVRRADATRLHLGEDLTLAARAADGRWHPLRGDAGSQRLNAAELGVGEALRVDLRAAFDPRSTNSTQRGRLDLDFRVTLREAAPTGDVPGRVDSGGAVPNTDDTDLWGWVLLAAALAGAGLAVAHGSGREEA